MLQPVPPVRPALPQPLLLQEGLAFENNVQRNRVWYRGDAEELDQLFRQLGQSPVARARFWAAATPGEPLRKAHSGLPGMLVDTLVGIVQADLGPMQWEDPQAEARWRALAKANRFEELVGRAIAEVLVTGDGAFRIDFDPKAGPGPLLRFCGADQVEPQCVHGRLHALTFCTPLPQQRAVLRETYAPGSVRYQLMQDGRPADLARLEETRALRDARFDEGVMLAVPLQFWPSARWPGRGRSLFDQKTDAFDAHDEVISQWMDAVRAGRVQHYIPEALVPRDPETGAARMPDPFGAHFIRVESPGGEGAEQQIQTVQPNISTDAYLAAYRATLDLCLQGIVSPATLGIDVARMSSAEAQREKKDVTGFTRAAITTALEQALPRLAETALQAEDIAAGRAPGQYHATLSFGEYGAPDFESRLRAVAAAADAGVMSIQAQVEELWGTSKDNAWKAAEVQRIRAERGLLRS